LQQRDRDTQHETRLRDRQTVQRCVQCGASGKLPARKKVESDFCACDFLSAASHFITRNRRLLAFSSDEDELQNFICFKFFFRWNKEAHTKDTAVYETN
jgi:succinate dehydrogenase/fumarate reductase-like Fe-S protein